MVEISRKEHPFLIRVTCFRSRRRFELDPVWVGVELQRNKAQRKAIRHFQAHCPACRAINKISVEEMRKDLEAASEAIAAALAQQAEAEPSPDTSQSPTAR
ncbi:MAG: hypothetical protein DDG58_10180 [Ardenticatenia bacterium]|nr:MAG: hypothetical protein DDG58_10180 [Ardenticatenia bacterium]